MSIKYQVKKCVSEESTGMEEKLSCFSCTFLYGRELVLVITDRA